MGKKIRLLYILSKETHPRPRDTYRLEVRNWKEIFHAHGSQKKAGIAILISNKIVFVQSLSHVWLWYPVDCRIPGFPVLHYLPEFAQTHVHWFSDAIQSFHSLSPPSPPALNLSQHWVLFQWVSSLHQVAKILELQKKKKKYWSFSFSISPSKEYSGLISFRINWFDLLAVQGTLMSILQYHNLKALILQCSAFFMVIVRKAFPIPTLYIDSPVIIIVQLSFIPYI